MSRVPFAAEPGLNSDDTSYAAKGGWNDANQTRFYEGRPQSIGGWEALSTTLLSGVCRNVMNWSDLSGGLQVAFGTNSNLEVYAGGGLYDITPPTGVSYAFIPITNGGSAYTAATVTFPTPGTGYRQATGTVILNGGIVAGIQITDPGLYPTGTTLAAPTFAGTGGSGATFGTPLSSAYSAGNINGTGGAGYGTGAYGVGTYGQPSTQAFWPQTWSLSPYGAYLVANPRGETIYIWTGNTASPATPVPNAPAVVTCSLVNNQRQLMAFGCTPADGSAFDPLMIRWSDLGGNYTTWQPQTSNNAGFTRLAGSGRIVKALMIGDYVLVWTSAALYLGTYTGNPSALWTFEKQGEHGGLIGPNAAAVLGQTAYWLSGSGQFFTYDVNGVPTVMGCPIRTDFFTNIATVQQDKIVASTVSKFGEVWWFYPDGRDTGGTNLENSRYIAAQPGPVNLIAPSTPTWTRGMLARTAFCDADPSSFPIGVDVSGNAYFHEKGASANGGVISYSMESADQYLDDSQTVMMIRGFWPDFTAQIGPVQVVIALRQYPEGPETLFGPFVCPPGTLKVDFRASGRLARVKYGSSASPSAWRLGAPAFDAVPAGQR